MFAEALNKKLSSLQDSNFYSEFVCDIAREACKPLKLDDVRKESFKNNISGITLYNFKTKKYFFFFITGRL